MFFSHISVEESCVMFYQGQVYHPFFLRCPRNQTVTDEDIVISAKFVVSYNELGL